MASEFKVEKVRLDFRFGAVVFFPPSPPSSLLLSFPFYASSLTVSGTPEKGEGVGGAEVPELVPSDVVDVQLLKVTIKKDHTVQVEDGAGRDTPSRHWLEDVL